jgi:hypothetical protein
MAPSPGRIILVCAVDGCGSLAGQSETKGILGCRPLDIKRHCHTGLWCGLCSPDLFLIHLRLDWCGFAHAGTEENTTLLE